MPFRVHKKVDGKDVVYTTAVLHDDETDITSDETPALASGSNVVGVFRDAVYGDKAAAEFAASKSTRSKSSSKTEGSK